MFAVLLAELSEDLEDRISLSERLFSRHDAEIIIGGNPNLSVNGCDLGNQLPARLAVSLEGVAPGVYRGHVLAEGLPDTALPLRLLVTASAPGSP